MRNGATIYHSVRSVDTNTGLETFAKPVAYVLRPNYLTIQPAGGFVDYAIYGEFIDQTNKAIAQPYERWIDIFHTGDRVYLTIIPQGYSTNTEPEDGWGFDADARIETVKSQNRAITLTIRNIVK